MTIQMPKMPEFKVNQSKNGYEIRSDILGLANKLVIEEYKAKLFGWEVSQTKDDEGKIVTKISAPEFPGLEKVLETAQKMYDFVNNPAKK
jgi:hypothetical protein